MMVADKKQYATSEIEELVANRPFNELHKLMKMRLEAARTSLEDPSLTTTELNIQRGVVLELRGLLNLIDITIENKVQAKEQTLEEVQND